MPALRTLFALTLGGALAVFGGAHSAHAQMSLTGAGGARPPYFGPGDFVSGAAAWWGIRGYTAVYSGKAVQLCTPSDASCEDESISNGTLLLGAVGATCNNSGNICTVKILYDQSGANKCSGGTAPCDATQAAIANRPKFVAAGAANGCTITTRPCLDWSSVSGFVTPVFGTSIAQPFSVQSVATWSNVAQYSLLVDGSESFFFYLDNTSLAFGIYAGSSIVGATSLTNGGWYSVQAIGNNPNCLIVTNGSAGTSGSCGSGNAETTDLFFLGKDNFSASFAGKMNEIGIWPVAFNSTQYGNLNTNARGYWGF